MVKLRTTRPEALEQILFQMREVPWEWRVDQLPTVAEKLGWRITKEMALAGAIVDTGMRLGGDEALFVYDKDSIDRVTIRLTEKAKSGTTEGRHFLQDAFADLVVWTTRLKGEPVRRIHGVNPRVRWRDDRFTVSIGNSGTSVTLTITPNARQDFWEQLEGGLL